MACTVRSGTSYVAYSPYGGYRWSENAGEAMQFVDQPTAAAYVGAQGISQSVEYITDDGTDNLGLASNNA